MQPILFKFAEARNRARKMLGVGPSVQGRLPLPATYLRISGITKDNAGAALASCTVHLFRTEDDAFVEQVVSGADGIYEFRSLSRAWTYYVVAYKAGFPDVSGTTVNTLVGA